MNELSVYEKKVILKMSKKIISCLFLILICSISCCFVTSCSEPDLGIDFVVEEEKEGPFGLRPERVPAPAGVPDAGDRAGDHADPVPL